MEEIFVSSLQNALNRESRDRLYQGKKMDLNKYKRLYEKFAKRLQDNAGAKGI
jgi:hypothetical protein